MSIQTLRYALRGVAAYRTIVAQPLMTRALALLDRLVEGDPVTPQEATRLGASRDQFGAFYLALERRLRQGVTPEACGSAFACAGACLACAALYETDTAGSGGVSFRAGDVSVTASAGGESTASTKALRELAERMMAPYLDDGGFCFRGVRA